MTGEPAADNVTAADCLRLHLAVVIGCARCREGRSPNFSAWSPALARRPLVDLFLEWRFKCRKCGSPSSDLAVAWGPGKPLASSKILDIRQN